MISELSSNIENALYLDAEIMPVFTVFADSTIYEPGEL